MNKNLTYGEIEYKTLSRVFKWIQKFYKDSDPDCWHNAFNVPGGIFLDLGHGLGKGILSATLAHQFKYCRGIELLESLYLSSIELKTKYNCYVANL